jgi:hypothetical protein
VLHLVEIGVLIACLWAIGSVALAILLGKFLRGAERLAVAHGDLPPCCAGSTGHRSHAGPTLNGPVDSFGFVLPRDVLFRWADHDFRWAADDEPDGVTTVEGAGSDPHDYH